jgi:hypothetical protein
MRSRGPESLRTMGKEIFCVRDYLFVIRQSADSFSVNYFFGVRQFAARVDKAINGREEALQGKVLQDSRSE